MATPSIENTAEAATVENLLTGAAVLVNGGAIQNPDRHHQWRRQGGRRQWRKNFRDLVAKTNRLLGTMDARTDQLSDSLTALSSLSTKIDAKSNLIADLMSAAAPYTDTLAQHTTQIADLVVQAGDASDQLAKFPSIAGTDTSGRSIIADMDTLSSAFNDVVLDPNTSLAAVNRLMPPVIKSASGNSISLKGGIDRLVLGHIPDIGFPGDPASTARSGPPTTS